MFRKPAELPQKPEVVSKSKIYEDLQIPIEDPVFSDAVRQIIAVNDAAVDSKSASTSSKTFDSIYEILQLEDELSSQKKILLEKFDSLSSLRDELKNARSVDKI